MEDQLPVAGAVRVERVAFRPAGRLLAADARHEPGIGRRPRLPRGYNSGFGGGPCASRAPPTPLRGGVPGASGGSGSLGRCALVYMDDCLVHSPTLEQHLLDVAEVLEIFRSRQLFAKSSTGAKCTLSGQWSIFV